jgi:hypothetical protein
LNPQQATVRALPVYRSPPSSTEETPVSTQTPERDDRDDDAPGVGIDWDRDRDGRMADYAAPDDAVPTVPYRPGG